MHRIAEHAQHIGKRLADASASGLADRVERLPRRVLSMPESQRIEALWDGLGELHLITEAYRRRESAPPGLHQDLRRAVGWPLMKDELLQDRDALRCRGQWLVVGNRRVSQSNWITRVESWLLRQDAGPEDSPRVAVLVDHVTTRGAGNAKDGGLTSGLHFEGTLAFAPSAVPMRALIDGDASWSDSRSKLPTTSAVLDDEKSRLLAERVSSPVLESQWIHACDIELRRGVDDTLWWTDADGQIGWRADLDQASELLALCDRGASSGFLVVDGDRADPLWLDTPIGAWMRT